MLASKQSYQIKPDVALQSCNYFCWWLATSPSPCGVPNRAQQNSWQASTLLFKFLSCLRRGFRWTCRTQNIILVHNLAAVQSQHVPDPAKCMPHKLVACAHCIETQILGSVNLAIFFECRIGNVSRQHCLTLNSQALCYNESFWKLAIKWPAIRYKNAWLSMLIIAEEHF